MKCTEPTPELVAAFPLHKGGADSRLRHEPYHKEDNTLRGIKCGFCYKGEIVRMIIGAIVDVDGTPSIKVIIDHKRVPAAYSTHILPIGKQEIPLPFLSIACPGVCVLGIVLVVHSRLLKDLEEVTDFASNSSATLYEDAEGVTPVAAKNTLDICSYKFMSVDMGVAFEMADYFVGVISTTIPDPPVSQLVSLHLDSSALFLMCTMCSCILDPSVALGNIVRCQEFERCGATEVIAVLGGDEGDVVKDIEKRV